MTVGSRSRKTHLGTCLPAPVSEKKVLNASSPPPMVLSDGIYPSGGKLMGRMIKKKREMTIQF